MKPPQFEKELLAYERECEKNDYSKRGLRTRLERLFFFHTDLVIKILELFNT